MERCSELESTQNIRKLEAVVIEQKKNKTKTKRPWSSMRQAMLSIMTRFGCWDKGGEAWRVVAEGPGSVCCGSRASISTGGFMTGLRK